MSGFNLEASFKALEMLHEKTLKILEERERQIEVRENWAIAFGFLSFFLLVLLLVQNGGR